MVSCHSCNNHFEGYQELAIHIASSKTGHRKGKKWAAGYLLKLKYLNSKKDNHGRSLLTKTEKENKKDMARAVSGETTVTVTVCPHCHRKKQQILPVEFSESRLAWREKDCLVVLCQPCRGVK